ncbi:Uncharacterized SAM-binding protein YcdF, DUF218 family [Microbacterium sp. cf046]|uniref:YdcF family protein n=1 Tax=Microbacterium sp. cf046 TaxID=1761803 RepID=UPI0008DF2939|nr:ElyC/SanA/YdcF family protein [Microbacterium sp. cf046]SFR94582.1 Uncharacterized SAM-binding protein YcdF, DUF218 family [Microbacterium sp. cf046]
MSRLLRVLLTIIAGVWLLVLIALPLCVFPAVDEIRPSDAVFVLGPPMDARLELAERLRDEGIVDEIVISVQPSGGQTAGDTALCREPGVTCEVPDPYTTRGEVLLMSEHARATGESSVIVVTSVPHVARARYIFGKCYPGEFTVLAVGRPADAWQWAQQSAYQSAALAKALFEPCPVAADVR